MYLIAGKHRMQVIALCPGTSHVYLDDRPEPGLDSPNDLKLQVLQVGICGTDREEAAGGRATPPLGRDSLVIGHEMLGRVTEVGSSVSDVHAGDYGLFTVRRGCGHCPACAANRSDICFSGD